ncbi:MAG: hypothetical protein QF886_09840, partial [Planctomycetota bacterium]|nr:hypothetical protein [Planctomycetota bacterium]
QYQMDLLRLDAAEGRPLQDVRDSEVLPGLVPKDLRAEMKCFLTVEDAQPRPGLKLVTVVVQWTSRADLPMEFRLQTLVAERRP